MKNILVFLAFIFLHQTALSFDGDTSMVELTPDEISLEIGADCRTLNDSLGLVIRIKNLSHHPIYLSDNFLGLSEGMSNKLFITENNHGKKTDVPYMGVFSHGKSNLHFPYSLIGGEDLYIRSPISQFYRIDLKNHYEITYNISFLLANKRQMFVGYARSTLQIADCEKDQGYLINYKKIDVLGVFVDPAKLSETYTVGGLSLE